MRRVLEEHERVLEEDLQSSDFNSNLYTIKSVELMHKWLYLKLYKYLY